MSKADRRNAVVAISPKESSINKFAYLFSKAVADRGHKVVAFDWRPGIIFGADVIILHWPDEFFGGNRGNDMLKSMGKLAMLRAAKLRGTKLVWVAHNVAAHDSKQAVPLLTKLFLGMLDGIIYLSEHSRELIGQVYPQTCTVRALVTVHGHYRDVAIAPAQPSRAPQGDVKLIYFGLIRPYKNLELLTEVAATVAPGLHLLIAGKLHDRALGDRLRAMVSQTTHVELDLREGVLSDAELEAALDGSDAVVLPYRTILNSGAALLALSRNRPILAPSIGSLPELLGGVGPQWVYLYEGEFTPEVLRAFLAWMHGTPRGEVAPLESYDWERVGAQIDGFIDALRGRG